MNALDKPFESLWSNLDIKFNFIFVKSINFKIILQIYWTKIES